MPARSKGEEAKRHIITMRVTPAMRERIQEAADESGRSVSQEIESRLEMSFQADQLAGGRNTGLLTRLISSSISLIELETGFSWTEDRMTWEAVRGAISRILDSMKPPTPDEIWHGNLDSFMKLLDTVYEVDSEENVVDGLQKAYPGIQSGSGNCPAEVVDRYSVARERLPELYSRLLDVMDEMFEGPMADYESLAKSARQLGREVAIRGKAGDHSNAELAGGRVQLFLRDGKVEPTKHMVLTDMPPELRNLIEKLATGLRFAIQTERRKAERRVKDGD